MSFKESIEGLKKPRELGVFKTEEVRDLDHAIDILNELRFNVTDKLAAWKKLESAKKYLDDILAEELGDPEKRSK